ncbi:MAG: 50S ribosomal protein L11 methyltransferase [Bacteroidales bacterium]
MDYIQLNLIADPPDTDAAEVIAVFLGEIGFESFEEIPGGLNAFIQASFFDEQRTRDLLASLPAAGNYTHTIIHIRDKNWNEEWERNFQPVIINDLCLIRASFHPGRPEIPYNILIDPRNAFGTGHHETTWLMIAAMFDISFSGKSVLDMGTGTGVLSILASMLGASAILAVDIDDWACRNAEENILLNKVDGIQVLKGDINDVPIDKVDVILANINRNILLEQMSGYARLLNKGGFLLLSGFLNTDLAILVESATEYEFMCTTHQDRNNWTAAVFIKN